MVLKSPPQTAKLPPIVGARARTADQLPAKRRFMPVGALRKPLIAWKTPPPMAPIVKAPPQSSTIRHGHGSREYSSIEWNLQLNNVCRTKTRSIIKTLGTN